MTADQPQGEFSGTPWAVGSMVGLRHFRLMADGSLVGMAGYAWAPGTNTALCDRRLAQATGTVPADHVVAHRDCSCGFWAYTSPRWLGRHDHGAGMLGIVEGFGHVTYGSKGFRSSKARLIAVVAPAPATDAAERTQWLVDQGKPAPSAELLSDVVTNPPRPHPVLSNLQWLALSWAVPLVIGFTIALAVVLAGFPQAGVLGVLAGTLVLGVVVRALMRASCGGVRLAVKETASRVESAVMVAYGTQLLHERYPEVEFYPTLADALRAHPLTTG